MDPACGIDAHSSLLEADWGRHVPKKKRPELPPVVFLNDEAA